MPIEHARGVQVDDREWRGRVSGVEACQYRTLERGGEGGSDVLLRLHAQHDHFMFNNQGIKSKPTCSFVGQTSLNTIGTPYRSAWVHNSSNAPPSSPFTSPNTPPTKRNLVTHLCSSLAASRGSSTDSNASAANRSGLVHIAAFKASFSLAHVCGVALMGTCERICMEMPAARMSLTRERPVVFSLKVVVGEIMLRAGAPGEMEICGMLER